MSQFSIVENNDNFFVTDPGGHAIHTASNEKEARQFLKKCESVVVEREAASKTAKRNSPRK